MAVRFVANKAGNVFMNCNDNVIKNKDDFYSISPYSPGGQKYSRRIYEDELGNGNNKSYNGGKPYMISRIAYNACQVDEKNKIKNKYNDVSSQDVAFSQGRKFSRNGGANFGNNTNNLQSAPINSTSRNSQLLTEEDYKLLYDTNISQDVPAHVVNPIEVKNIDLHNTRQFERILKPHFGGRPIPGIGGKFYVPYKDDVNLYIQCQDKELINIDEMKSRYSEYKRSQEAKGNALQGKTIYCGKTIQDIVKAKMCGQVTNEDIPDMQLETLGSPGECFEYGKVYKSPLVGSYMYYLHDV